MRLDNNNQTRRRLRFLRAWFNLPNLVLVAALGSLTACLLSLGIIVGARIQQGGNDRYIRFLTQSPVATNIIHPALSSAKAMIDGLNVPRNLASGIAASAQLDRLVIDIKHLDYQRLAFKREQALSLGVLFTDATDYVPATISLGDISLRAKIRLKGDAPDHYETDKWSLRIKLEGDHTLLGMRVFSIQDPGTRNYIYEWVMLEILRREGLLGVRYHFVDVTINGKHMGIYALEEHFEKRLIEHAERRAGPIVKFNEDPFWRKCIVPGDEYDDYGAFTSAAIDGFDKSVTPEFERAVSLLEAFRRGRLTTCEVFDCEQLAMFVALADLGGAPGIRWQNLRFYYNPITSKLEPIGFDTEADPYHEPITKLFCFDGGIRDKRAETQPDDVMQLYFRDQAFCSLYVQALERVSTPEYLDGALADINDELLFELSILYREYPYLRWSDDFLRRNQEFIRGALSPAKAIHAYAYRHEAADLRLKLANIQSLPVEIIGISDSSTDLCSPADRIVLPPKRDRQPPQYVIAGFPLPPGSSSSAPAPDGLRVHYRILGTKRTLTEPIFPWEYMVDSILDGDWLTQRPDLDEFPCLSVDNVASTIRFRPGRWTIDRNLVIPKDYVVSAGPGVRLDLRAGAKIISYSPIAFQGSDELPVVVESSDATGQGLIVIAANQPSILQHVIFDNLGPLHENGWQVPAAVAFYESPVDLESVEFRRNRSEDALNILRSPFTMVRTVFSDTQADAFDGDFVHGQILQCAFLRCGNDAIDVSGSVIEIAGVHMDGVGDKALSAGEESIVHASDVQIRHAELGISSKDLATISVRDISFEDTRVAVAAYQKKPEFGQAVIHIERIAMENVERPYLIEHGSRVIVDGTMMQSEMANVKGLLYGAEYGRSSE